MNINAVLFDFDGTLTLPGSINFKLIRETIDCPKEQGILEYIASIKNVNLKNKAIDHLNKFEAEAATKSQPNIGVEDVVCELIEAGYSLGIITRNSILSVNNALKNFKILKPSDFGIIITRDCNIKPKPSPDGISLAAKKLQIPKSDILYVGDYLFDIEAGFSAGVKTIYLANSTVIPDFHIQPDYIIRRLKELMEIIAEVQIKN